MLAPVEVKNTLDALQTIQLMYVLGYYHPRNNYYKSRGICYGFAYTNAFALLLGNKEIIENRAIILRQLLDHVCSLAEEKLKGILKQTTKPNFRPSCLEECLSDKKTEPSISAFQDYQNDQKKYYNILDYILMILRDKDMPELTAILAELKEVLEQFSLTLLINNENALTHLHAYFDSISVMNLNILTKSRSINNQNARDLFPLFLPVQCSAKDLSIHTCETIAGVFNQQKLARILALFSTNTLIEENLLKPVVFILHSEVPIKSSFFRNELLEHSVMIAYNPAEKKWAIIDSLTSRLMEFDTSDTMPLTEEIMREFCFKKTLSNTEPMWRSFFIHVLTIDENDLKLINNHILKSKLSEEWQRSLISGCYERDNNDYNVNLIKNCLIEGTAEEIKSFFSDPAIKKLATAFYLDNACLVNFLLQARYQDPLILSLLEALLESGISIHSTNKNGRNAIHELIYIFREKKKPLSATILECFKFLFRNGVDINHIDSENGVSPLGSATCYHGMIHIELVELLLNNNADPNVLLGRDKNTCIMASLVYSYMECRSFSHSHLAAIKLLMEHGINLELRIKAYDYKGFEVANDKKISLIEYIQYQITEGQRYAPENSEELSNILAVYESNLRAVRP